MLGQVPGQPRRPGRDVAGTAALDRVDRPLLERYLAWLASQAIGHGARTDATRLLFQQLSDASRALLGVTGTVTSKRAFLAAYRRVRYCFHAILSVTDPRPSHDDYDDSFSPTGLTVGTCEDALDVACGL